MAWRCWGDCAFANTKPGVGFRPKTRNRAFVAWFRACHVRWQCGEIMGDGGCQWMAWRHWGYCAFTNVKLGVGFRPKTQNRAFVAWFQACRVRRQCGAIMKDGGCQWMAWRHWGDCTFANSKPGLGFRPKTRNRAFVAWFWACCVKWWCGAMTGDGRCRWMAWRHQGGCVFTNAKPGGGV